jgi:hypothetical protein
MKDIIKIYTKEIGFKIVDSVRLAQERDPRRTPMNEVMSFPF